MISQYKLLEELSAETLNLKVVFFLKAGWQLYGNPGIVELPKGPCFAQAMVWYKENI